MIPNFSYDIVIIGGGMVGLVLAHALAPHSFRIAVVEATEPKLNWTAQEYDARVCALNDCSCDILRELNVFSTLEPASCSRLEKMTVWDEQGGGTVHFDAADLGLPELGYIVENRALVKALWHGLSVFSNVDLIFPHAPESLAREAEAISISLDDKKTIQASLVVAADGAHSWLRQHMTSELVERPYQQHAIVAVIESAKPHQQTAWQNFLAQGPVGILPLAEAHREAIVWSTAISHAEKLMAMPEVEFNLVLTNALELRLGRLKLVSARQKIPLMMRHAKHYVAERMALIGDAAHTIHPLAGQGVNLGILDALCLAECLVEARAQQRDMGSLRPLRQYERTRKSDNELMLASMQGFKELFTSQSSLLIQLRSQGLNWVDRTAWLKRYFMRQASQRNF